jgi:hypothetical protein
MDQATVSFVILISKDCWKRLTRKHPDVPEFESTQECPWSNADLGIPTDSSIARPGNL